MYITVAATEDLSSSDTILLEVGSYSFEDAPYDEDVSMYLIGSVYSLLGMALISYL